MPDYTDAETITTVATPSAVEVYGAVDAATFNTTTTPSSAEEHTIYDATTISTILSLTADERGPFTDTETPISKTTIITYEMHIHPTGFWGPFDTDGGRIPAEFIDAKTINTSTHISSVEEYN